MADGRPSQLVFPDLGQGLAAADAAARGGDHDAALRIFAGLRADAPDAPEPILRNAVLLTNLHRFDECEALLDATEPRFRDNPDFAVERAWVAHHRRDFAATLGRWQSMRERFPNDARAPTGMATTLRVAGRLDEADALLAEIIARFPDMAGPAIERARIAMSRADWAEAAQRWAYVRDHFPQQLTAYTEAAMALRLLRRVPEAEALLQAATLRFGEQPGLAIERIRLSMVAAPRELAALVDKAAALRERFPDHEPAAVVGVDVLREAGHLQEAEDLAARELLRFPNSASLAARRADIALAKMAQPDAAKPLAAAPDRAEGNGEDSVPANAEIGIARAMTLLGRQEWKAALSTLLALRTRFPGDRRIEQRIFETRLRVAETDPEAAALLADPDAMPNRAKPDDAEALRDLVMQFESLGGTGHGCEFGIFQRSFGAEPLGLLRWADLDHRYLTDALESRFQGVGDPAQTEVIVPEPDGESEYWTRDRRFWMAMRCFIRTDSIPQEKMEVQACRRLQFLRRKLIEDLEAGSKLFVYKNMFRNLTAEELDRLHRAVRSYGPRATLFYVRYSDAENPPGSVRAAGPGLIVGHIAHFRHSPENVQLESATEGWLALCQAAVALWRGKTAAEDASLPTRDLMMRFESLGALEGGCEFGLVQRAFGAEPLGLLRWTEIGPEQLMVALESDFAGVGDPAQSELIATPSPSGQAEYQTRDRRFGMRMHTFVQAGTIGQDAMLAQSCRRLLFLRRKMLDDLAGAAKIFVYKITMRDLTPGEIARLHAAVRRHGPATLLYVRYADAAHPNGTVEVAAPGLLIGYIDRFNVTPEGKSSEPAFGSWETICRHAYRLWTSGKAGQTEGGTAAHAAAPDIRLAVAG